MKENLLFIINPVSGRKSKDDIPGLIRQSFGEEDYQVKIIYTSFSGEATQIAKQYYHQGYKKIIAVGGDGTINEVASALAETKGVLGIVPVGSGNGLARHLNLPMRVRKALSLIKKGDYKTIDFGTINDQKFFCTSGVGFDAHIGDVFARSQGRGFVSYLKATLLEFKRYRPERYEISINGTTYLRDAFLITFANASQYGNNAHIAPKAQVDDGKLEVSVMKPFPWIAAPGMGIRLFAKNMDKSRYVETFRGEKIVVKRKKPGVIHYDGEPGKMGEILTVRLIPKGLRVIVS